MRSALFGLLGLLAAVLAYVPIVGEAAASRLASRCATPPTARPRLAVASSMPAAARNPRRSRVLMSTAKEGDDDRVDSESRDTDAPMMAELSQRVDELRDLEELRQRFEQMPHAWVLVFDPDSDDEAVYSVELPQHEEHVVVAFEDEDEARSYAASLDASEHLEDLPPSVQALDLAALVVSSREANFRVALVMRGDLRPRDEPATQGWGADGTVSTTALGTAAWHPSPALTLISLSPPPPVTTVASPYAGLITHGSPPPLSVLLTMVPEELYADRSSSDFFDPLEDAVWVLLHDEGTPDEQFFSMELNGTRSVVCFRNEAAADRCVRNLEARVGARPAARQVLLEEVLDALHAGTDLTELGGADVPAAGGLAGACGAGSAHGDLGEVTLPDVYLVDEVDEVDDDGPDSGGERPSAADGEQASAGPWGTLQLRPVPDAKPASDGPRGARRVHPRARLESIYASADAGDSGDQMLFEHMVRDYTGGDADSADATGP